MKSKPILLIEDNSDDFFIAKRALQATGILNPLQHVEDGDTAIRYLSGEGKFADRNRHPLPALVLLDLRMPGKSGFEVLEWMRSCPEWKDMPVVVLTHSAEVADTDHAYALGANSYLIKPLTFEQVRDTFKSLSLYWPGLLGFEE